MFCIEMETERGFPNSLILWLAPLCDAMEGVIIRITASIITIISTVVITHIDRQRSHGTPFVVPLVGLLPLSACQQNKARLDEAAPAVGIRYTTENDTPPRIMHLLHRGALIRAVLHRAVTE